MTDPQRTASAVRPDEKLHGSLRHREEVIEKNMTEHGSELFDLVKAYAQQETIDPLRSIGRVVGIGLGAAILGGLGILLLLLGVLRVLQTETGEHLTGSLTWVPYAATLVVAVIFIFLAVIGMRRPPKKGAR